MRYTLTTPRDGWLRNGLLAGLVATGGMTIALVAAYVIADGVGDPRGGVVARWLWALAHNRVTEAVGGGPLLFIGLQLSVGLALSALYAGAAEPALPGPGWARGIVFALGPWVLSLVLFLPLVGGGLFGRALGAGPLPALGNLIVHLIYGAILGAVYAIPESAGLARTPEDLAANVRADRGAAIGIVAGAAVGALIGALIQAVGGTNPLLPAGGLILGGALIGGGWGGVVGSLAGLTPATRRGKAR